MLVKNVGQNLRDIGALRAKLSFKAPVLLSVYRQVGIHL